MKMKIGALLGISFLTMVEAQRRFYPNTPFREQMTDAPWIVCVNDTIPFLLMLKDGNGGNAYDEIHCLAVYDITDGVKYYENGKRFTPEVNDDKWGNLKCPPLTPDPTVPGNVPNQVYYYHFSIHPISSDNFRHWIKNTFENPGSKWPGQAGFPITPNRLGYQAGDTITFRTVILAEDSWDEGYSDVHHLKDLKVIVSSGYSPFPRMTNWFALDAHYHTWNTDNIHEYGAPTDFVAKAAKRIGLNCVMITDHSCDVCDENEWDDDFITGLAWDHIAWEASQYTDVTLVRGEEISGHRYLNLPVYERHHVAYGLSDWVGGEYPPLTPNYPATEVADRVVAFGGFVYLAHPAFESSFYPFVEFPNGDTIWELEMLAKEGCRGLELFNERNTHESGNELHPWGEENPATGGWEKINSGWDTKMLAVLKRYDGYLSQGLSPVRKFFLAGGSDGHGATNYVCAHYNWLSPDADAYSSAMGCFRTNLYLPGGLHPDSIARALKYGRSSVTDGPSLVFGIDENGDGDLYDLDDSRIGDGDDDEDGVLDPKSHIVPDTQSTLRLFWKSNANFGKVEEIKLLIGSKESARDPLSRQIAFCPSYEGDCLFQMRDILYGVDSGSHYLRMEATSRTGSAVGQTYRCWTNPIWIYRLLPRITQVSVTPNPFDATEESTIVHFHVEDYPGYITFTIGAIKFLDEQYLQPGEYSIVWQGREDTTSTSRVALPGSYPLHIYTSGICQHMSNITVEGTQISGVLEADTYWTESGEPYVLMSDLTLKNNMTLFIAPGVKVMPRDVYVIKYLAYPYYPSLIAEGAAGNKIQFTPHRKILPLADPLPHRWKGIRFSSNYSVLDSLILKQCVVEAAGTDTGAIVNHSFTKAPVNMSNDDFVDCHGYVYLDADGRTGNWWSSVTIDSCLFEDNDSLVKMSFSSFKSMVGNSFVNNQSNIIRLMTSRRWDSGVLESDNARFVLMKRTEPYHWVSGIASNDGSYCATLTIKPGTTFLFEDSAQLSTHHQCYYRGRIVAVGEPAKHIVFSGVDTTKSWANILIDNPIEPSCDTSKFEYCEFSYAGTCCYPYYDSAAICLSDVHRPFVLKNSVLKRNRGYGLAFRGRYDDLSDIPEIKDNEFIGNDLYPLKITSNCLRGFSNNSFSGNHPDEILVIPDARININLVCQNQGVPYRVSGGDLIVKGQGDTTVVVQVEPGNVLKFRTNLKFSVEDSSQLLAQGVTFTSVDPCSAWIGLSFTNASHDTSCIDSCHIENVTNHITLGGAGVTINGKTNLRVVNSKIESNDVGFKTQGINNNDNPWIWISGNEITQNRKYGIWIQNWDWTCGTGHHYIRHNKIWRNDTAIIHSVGNDSRTIRADSNWWGHHSGPNDQSLGGPDYNPDGQGDTIGNWIQYREWTEYLPPVGSIAVNGSEPFTNSPFSVLNLASQNPNTTDSLPADSMMIWQFRLVQGQPVKDSTGWIPYARSYPWRLRQNQGTNTVYVRYMIEEDTLKSPEYKDSIYVDWTSPETLQMVINHDSLFTNSPSCTLCSHTADTASGICAMRFGNDSLVNLVHNSDMTANTHWFYNHATYHDSLDLFELTIAEDTNYFYQRIWSDTILARETYRYDGDSMSLAADLVIDHFKGNGRLEARCVYYCYPMIGWPDSITVVPAGGSVTIPETTLSRTSLYRLMAK